ncbi:mCG146918, partial [Mus musculus]
MMSSQIETGHSRTCFSYSKETQNDLLFDFLFNMHMICLHHHPLSTLLHLPPPHLKFKAAFLLSGVVCLMCVCVYVCVCVCVCVCCVCVCVCVC